MSDAQPSMQSHRNLIFFAGAYARSLALSERDRHSLRCLTLIRAARPAGPAGATDSMSLKSAPEAKGKA